MVRHPGDDWVARVNVDDAVRVLGFQVRADGGGWGGVGVEGMGGCGVLLHFAEARHIWTVATPISTAKHKSSKSTAQHSTAQCA